jgi:hypothetical protein
MTHQPFVDYFIREILDFCSLLISGSTPDKLLPGAEFPYESHFLALLFLFLSCCRSFSTGAQLRKFKPFAEARLGMLSRVCAHLETIASRTEFDVRPLLEGITATHFCELLQTSVPFFTFIGLKWK